MRFLIFKRPCRIDRKFELIFAELSLLQNAGLESFLILKRASRIDRKFELIRVALALGPLIFLKSLALIKICYGASANVK